MGPSSTTSSSDAPSTGVYTAITSPHAGDAYDEFPEPSTLDLIEPLAIVGFSLKFPEDATDADSFWDMLINGRNVSSEFPKDRLNIDSFNDPKNDRLGTISMRGGHFVKGDLGAFDAPFFSITPAEAAAMDPQQRTLLEVAYRALENAGSPIDALVGSDTSVHTGCFTADYANLMAKDPDQVHKYTATGTAATMLSNRINWFFDLKGTSVTLDSACSSSIVALDLACQGLWNHTTSMALVAGCNLINQDGHTPGITQPSQDSQAALIRSTYERAGLGLEDTRFFEAHGTGTAMGDPIEAGAIGSAFQDSGPKDEPLYIGSVKANIGHLEGAAGIAGLIKTVMVLEKGIIPPIAAFKNLNPKIDADFLRLKLWRENIETGSEVARPEIGFCVHRTRRAVARNGQGVAITLVDLLRSFGVSPTAVVGHSSGEIAAAYSVGAISCESALRIAYFRGIFATEVANTSRSKGRMMAVGLSVAAVQPYIDTVKDLPGDLYRLTVSCINSPGGVTISGDEQYIDILLANLQADKVFARKLQVTVAYHSAQMLEVAEKYGASIGTIEPGDYVPKLSAMVSSVTGQRATHSELQQPDYWVRNMTSPVKFSPALESMCLQKPEPVTKKLDGSHRKIIMVHDLLELGPHSALQGPIREILQKVNRAEDMKYYSALVRGRSALDTTFEALGQLYCRGYPVDIAKINRPTKSISQPMLLVDLPEYPFDHSKSYWFESRLSKSFRFRKHGYNPLLGTPVSDWNPLEGKWRHFLGGSDLPWVEDHKINGAILYPAAGMCIMAIEAARQMAEDRPIKAFEIKNATFHTALTIPISGKIETQFSLRPLRDASDKDNQWSDFRVDIYQDEKWIETSRGSIQVIYETEEQVVDHGRELKQELATIQEHHQHAAAFCGEPTDSVKLYEGLHGMSYQYGPAFKPITQLQVDKHGVAIGEVALNHASIEEREDPARPCVIHPTTLDGMLQMSLAALTEGGQKVVTTRIPTRIRNLVLDKSQKKVLLKLEGFETTTISNSDTSAQEEPESQRLCYGIHMKPDIELIAADKLTDYCDQVEVEVDPEQYFKQLHQLKLRYMSDALKELVKHPIAQDQIPTHFQKYIAWMHLQLAQGDFQDTDLNVDDIAQVDHQKALILRTGENLVPILRGEVDPLALFFKDDLMRKFYNMGHVRSTGFSKFAKYLDLLAHKNPTMKFLEVGAGTGATTEIILGNLTKGESVQYGRYDFSDISAGFFGPAQELFGEARNLNFLVLDVENDIEKQGVEVGSYDVVVAAHRLAKVLQSEGLGSNYQVLSLEKVAAIPAHELPSLVFLSELERPLLANLSEQSFGNLQQILNSAKEVLWVTEGGGTPQTANSGMSTGLARVLSTERGSLSIVTLHLESGEACLETELAEHASKIASVFRKSFHNSDHQSFESEYTEVDGLLQIPRIIEDTVLDNQVAQYCAPSQLESIEWRKAPPLKLSIGAPGLLDTLQFIEDDTYAIPMGPTEVEIQVKAVGVNFRDCLLALGRLDTGVFGCECSGIVSRVGSECTTFKPGDRVTVAYLNTYQTFVRAPQECVAPIPGFMSFVEAASVPTTFVTVYHGLVILAQLQKGESILIHAASGGTGQAAIQIAQHLGATIYVTVGTEEKKQHLKDTYGISDDQILFSRDISFAQGIKRLTKGRGVDVVLNSLSGESLAASWECVAPFGRFIEIGKKDIQSHNKISMSPFEENHLVKKSFGPVMELMGQKVLRPANPLVTYGIGNVEGAMRLMQSGKNIGKIVIEVDDEAEVQALIKAKPAYEFTRDATYLITGGLGGLGRSISRWMVARGARNLLLLGRSGATSAAAKSFMQDMEALGVTVMAPKCDIANLTALKEILEDCVKIMPPLQGCIHGAMVLRDAVFQTMPYTDWTTCITPKVHGAWNLHTLLPSNLKFFISLSSVCGTIGQGGQANYAAANTYLDALTHLRISQGLAATSIDLGPMLEEGFVAENAEIMRRFESVGTLTAVQIITALKPPADLTASGIEIPTWLTRPLFTHLHTIPSLTLSPTSSTSSTHFSFATAFTSVTSLSEASAIVTSELAKRLSKILSIPVSEMDEHRPIHGFGLDSLVAVELRNWFEREVRAEVAVFEILGGGVGGSLRGLGERGAGRSGFRGAW
ncbi:putative Phthiocerol synthesis polyketide synthase type I PpsC [Glarea lozoyensis 74030]|uniref:Putative Phthiocerol synthesis polyketide synthase type I PpsC n=1 Tax=Glarea lozoyensis (strain ATCC 74030 / MF5533) TaxID=1104152 RepID=H0EQ34_GLAL7|nr:putative Phthiocerol synthesis polyketide synthase type I PpsC [Glarea lozoyensis 74030]